MSPEDDQALNATKRPIGDFVRVKPKPHEEMNISGKRSSKKKSALGK